MKRALQTRPLPDIEAERRLRDEQVMNMIKLRQVTNTFDQQRDWEGTLGRGPEKVNLGGT
jgi:hypothetical protein